MKIMGIFFFSFFRFLKNIISDVWCQKKKHAKLLSIKRCCSIFQLGVVHNMATIK